MFHIGDRVVAYGTTADNIERFEYDDVETYGMGEFALLRHSGWVSILDIAGIA